MFKVRATMDAGMGTIGSDVGIYKTNAEAKRIVRGIVANGFWGTPGATPFTEASDTPTFFCPRYIKRVSIVEIGGET